MNEVNRLIAKVINDTASKKDHLALDKYSKHPKVKEEILMAYQLEADLRSIHGTIDVVEKTMEQLQKKSSKVEHCSNPSSKIVKTRLSDSKRMRNSRVMKKVTSDSKTSRRMRTKKIETSQKRKGKDQGMIWMSVLSGGIILVIVFAIMMRLSSQPEVSENAKVTWLSGPVKLIREHVTYKVEKGMILESGDELVVDKNGEICFEFDHENTKVILSEEAKMGISIVKGDKLLHLHQGLIKADVETQTNGKSFSLKTPFAKIEALGTSYQIESRPNFTKLDVEEGDVFFESSSGVKQAMIKAGHYAKIGPRIPFMFGKSQSDKGAMTFSFVNIKTRVPIDPYNPISEGSVIKIRDLEKIDLNLKANLPREHHVHSIRFELIGPKMYKHLNRGGGEVFSPFLIKENAQGDLPKWDLVPGIYKIKCYARTGSGEIETNLKFMVQK